MVSLLLLSLLGVAQAATSVLVAGFEAQDQQAGEIAARLPELLRAELMEGGGFELPEMADVPPIGGQAADLYLEVCPPGQMEGCSYVLAGAAGARLALTGSVHTRPSGMWVEGEEPPPPEVMVDLKILDVEAYHEALAVTLTYSEETENTFTDSVPLMLQDVVDGLVGEEVDIRHAAKEPQGRRAVEEDEELEDLDDVGDHRAEGSLTTAPHREERQRLSLEELEAQQPEHPWEALGIDARQYLTWWNSGWDYGSWSTRLDGRRGQLLLRLHGGLGLGPTVGRYYGRVSYGGEESVSMEEVYATHELVSGWGSQLGLTVAYGLTPTLEIEAGVSREGGHYAMDVRMEFPTSEQARKISDDKDGFPQVWLGARWVPWPERVLRPAAGAGVAVWWGHSAELSDLPMNFMPVFSPPTVVSLRLAPGAELRLARQADLVLGVPLHVLLVGTAPATYDELVLQGSDGMAEKREPERAFPLAFGVQAGVQVRFGGRHKEPAAPELGEDELD